jgi:DNA-binding CsgD family transcriptional regulator
VLTQRDQLFELIQHLYAAPGSTEAWALFLDRLCTALSGCGASFISHDLRSHHANVALTVRTDPEAVRSYHDQWGAHDPWARSPRLQTVPPSAVIVGDELVSHSEFKQTEYYGEFASRYDIVRCIAGMIETGPNVFSVISINGTERRGSFGTGECELMDALMPHVHRALQLHRRLARTESAYDQIAELVDRASHGVVLVNRAGRVTYMNSAAECLCEARDGFTVDGGEPRAARAVDTERLRRLLAAAAATSDGDGLSSGGVLALGRPSGRRPLIVVVSPLARDRPLFADSEMPVAILMLTDLDRQGGPDERILRELYRLTPGEANLARLLAEGVSVEKAGTRLGLRTATVRTRLKAIFEKTNTHRQSELVRLLLRGAPHF